MMPHGSRAMDFRVLWSLSRKLVDLGATDQAQSGKLALQRYICDWVERKAYIPEKADELFEPLWKGLTLILDMGATSATCPGLSINIAAFEAPRHQDHIESFYMLSCTGSIPSETIGQSTIKLRKLFCLKYLGAVPICT